MSTNYMTINELIEKKFKKIFKNEPEFQNILECVNNKYKASKYIRRILEKYDNNVIIPVELLSKADYRIKHVLYSFALGVTFFDFNNIEKELKHAYKTKYFYYWLSLSLYHDYGYFIGSGFLSIEDIDDLVLDYNIFNSNKWICRYSKNLLKEYYKSRYINNINKIDNADFEVGDHGVLGGTILYNNLQSILFQTKKSIDTDNKFINYMNLYLNKTMYRVKYTRYNKKKLSKYHLDICSRIMEHNIWKNYNGHIGNFTFNEINEDNFKLINRNEIGLYLLSLVDTIEFTKKFCKYNDVDLNGTREFSERYPKTIGNKIKIKVEKDIISLDYSELNKIRHIKNIEKWYGSISELNKWVCINVDNDTNHCVINIRKKDI